MKLNNKGFAISTIMYMVLVLAVLIMVLTLTVLNGRKLILEKQQKTASTNIYNYIQNKSSFSTVFTFEGPCDFNGINGNITGESCTLYTDSYIDTGVKLFDNKNYLKDFEIYFELSNYNYEEQTTNDGNNAQVIVSSRFEDSNSNNPGFAIVRNENRLTLVSRTNGITNEYNFDYENNIKIRILRRNNMLYYSINNGPLTFFQDYSDFTEQFDTTVTFGGIEINGVGKRLVKATISNMRIRLGVMSDENFLGN